MQNYALDIAVSKMLKDRCIENLNILKQIKKDEEIEKATDADLKYISERIKAFDSQRNSIYYTKEFYTECMPHISSLKKVLGDNNELYLNVCSAVVSRVMNTVNASVNANQTKSNISNAISVMKLISGIDMPRKLRNNLTMNTFTLSSMLAEKREHSVFAENPRLIICIIIAIIAFISFISFISNFFEYL